MYKQRLPQYAFGDWLKDNGMSMMMGPAGLIANKLSHGKINDFLSEHAGAIGSIGGAAVGTALGGPAGGAMGASIGGAAGGFVQNNYQQDEQASEEEKQMQQMQFRNRINMANQRLSNNNFQGNNFGGTSNFAGGGRLNPIQPNNVGTVTQPNRNLSIPYNRVNQLATATFGTTSDPFGEYFNAVDRSLTPTTQNFIYNRTGATSPEEAAVKETLNSSPRTFFSTDNKGVNRLIPTTQIPLDKAIQAKKFITDLYNRGQIKYANGGELRTYSGQTHSGSQGGIMVDQLGNPSVINNTEPVGKVENNETVWTDPETKQEYIFSDRLTL